MWYKENIRRLILVKHDMSYKKIKCRLSCFSIIIYRLILSDIYIHA